MTGTSEDYSDAVAALQTSLQWLCANTPQDTEDGGWGAVLRACEDLNRQLADLPFCSHDTDSNIPEGDAGGASGHQQQGYPEGRWSPDGKTWLPHGGGGGSGSARSAATTHPRDAQDAQGGPPRLQHVAAMCSTAALLNTLCAQSPASTKFREVAATVQAHTHLLRAAVGGDALSNASLSGDEDAQALAEVCAETAQARDALLVMQGGRDGEPLWAARLREDINATVSRLEGVAVTPAALRDTVAAMKQELVAHLQAGDVSEALRGAVSALGDRDRDVTAQLQEIAAGITQQFHYDNDAVRDAVAEAASERSNLVHLVDTAAEPAWSRTLCNDVRAQLSQIDTKSVSQQDVAKVTTSLQADLLQHMTDAERERAARLRTEIESIADGNVAAQVRNMAEDMRSHSADEDSQGLHTPHAEPHLWAANLLEDMYALVSSYDPPPQSTSPQAAQIQRYLLQQFAAPPLSAQGGQDVANGDAELASQLDVITCEVGRLRKQRTHVNDGEPQWARDFKSSFNQRMQDLNDAQKEPKEASSPAPLADQLRTLTEEIRTLNIGVALMQGEDSPGGISRERDSSARQRTTHAVTKAGDTSPSLRTEAAKVELRSSSVSTVQSPHAVSRDLDVQFTEATAEATAETARERAVLVTLQHALHDPVPEASHDPTSQHAKTSEVKPKDVLSAVEVSHTRPAQQLSPAVVPDNQTQLLAEQVGVLAGEVRDLRDEQTVGLGSDAGHVGDAVAEADRERGALEELHASLVSQPTPQSANVSSDVMTDVLKDIGDKVSRLESASMTPDAMEALVSGMKEDILAQLKAVPSAHSSEQLVSTVEKLGDGDVTVIEQLQALGEEIRGVKELVQRDLGEYPSGDTVAAAAEAAREREALEVLHQSVHERSMNDPESSEPAWAQKLRDDLTEKVSRLEASSVTPDELRKLTDEVRDVVTQQLSSASSPAVVPDNQTQLLAEQVGVLAGEVRDLRDEQTVGLGSDAGHVGDAVAEADRERGALEELHASLRSQPSSPTANVSSDVMTDVLKDIGDKVSRLESASMTPEAMEALVSGMKEDILAQLKAVPSAHSSEQLVSTVEKLGDGDVTVIEQLQALGEEIRGVKELVQRDLGEYPSGDTVAATAETAREREALEVLHQSVHERSVNDPEPSEPAWAQKLREDVNIKVSKLEESLVYPAEVRQLARGMSEERMSSPRGQFVVPPDTYESTVSHPLTDEPAWAQKLRDDLTEKVSRLQASSVTPDELRKLTDEVRDVVTQQLSSASSPAVVPDNQTQLLAEQVGVLAGEVRDLRDEQTVGLGSDAGHVGDAVAEADRERGALEELHASLRSQPSSPTANVSSDVMTDVLKDIGDKVSRLESASMTPDAMEALVSGMKEDILAQLKAVPSAHSSEQLVSTVEKLGDGDVTVIEQLQDLGEEIRGVKELVQQDYAEHSIGEAVEATAETAREREALEVLHQSVHERSVNDSEPSEPAWAQRLREDVNIKVSKLEESLVYPAEVRQLARGMREERMSSPRGQFVVPPDTYESTVSHPLTDEPAWAQKLRDDLTEKVSRLEASSVTPDELRKLTDEVRDVVTQQLSSASSPAVVPDNQTQLLAEQVGVLAGEVRDLRDEQTVGLGSDAGHVGDAVAEADRERGALEELHASLRSQPSSPVPDESTGVLADVLKDIGDKVSRLESASMTPDAMEALVSGMKAQLKAVPSAQSSEQLVSTVEVNSGEAVEATAETAREREALEVLHQSVHERSAKDPDSSEPAWAQKLRDDLTEKVSRLEACSVTPDELRKLTDEVRDVVTQQLSSASSPAVVPDNQTQLLAEQVGVLAGEVRDLRDEQTVGLGSDAGHVGDAVAEADRERGALEELHASLRSQPSSPVPPESTGVLADVLKDIGDKVSRLESASMTPDAMEALVSGMKEDILAQLKAVPSAQSSDQLVSTVEVNSGEAVEATAETAREREALEVLHQSVHERSVNDPDSSEPAWAQKLRDDLTEKVSRLEASSVTPDELRKLTDEVRDVLTQQLSSASSPAVVADNQTQLLAEQVGVLAGEVRDLRDEQTVGLGSDAGHVGDAVAEADRERGALEELHASLRSQPSSPTANVSSDVMTEAVKHIGDKVSRIEAALSPTVVENLVKREVAQAFAKAQDMPRNASYMSSDSEISLHGVHDSAEEAAREMRALAELERSHASEGPRDAKVAVPMLGPDLVAMCDVDDALGSDAGHVGDAVAEADRERGALEELHASLRSQPSSPTANVSSDVMTDVLKDIGDKVSRLESASMTPDAMEALVSGMKEDILAQLKAVPSAHSSEQLVSTVEVNSGEAIEATAETAREREALEVLHQSVHERSVNDPESSEPAWAQNLREDMTEKVSRLEASSVTPDELRKLTDEVRDVVTQQLSSASSPAVVPDNQTQLLAEQVGVLAGEVRDLRDEQTVGLGSDAGHVGDAVAEADRERGALEELHASLRSQPSSPTAHVSSDVMTDVLKDIGDKVSRLESASMTPDAMEALVSGMKEDILAQLKAVPSAHSSEQLVSTVEKLGDGDVTVIEQLQALGEEIRGVKELVQRDLGEYPSGDTVAAAAEAAREREALEVLHQSVHERSMNDPESSEPAWAQKLRDDLTEKVSRLEASSVTPDELRKLTDEVRDVVTQQLSSASSPAVVPDNQTQLLAEQVGVLAGEVRDLRDEQTVGLGSDAGHVGDAVAEADRERGALEELHASLRSQPSSPTANVSSDVMTDVLKDIGDKVSRLESASMTPDAMEALVSGMKEDILAQLKAVPSAHSSEQLVSTVEKLGDGDVTVIEQLQALGEEIRGVKELVQRDLGEYPSGDTVAATTETAREREALEVLHQSVASREPEPQTETRSNEPAATQRELVSALGQDSVGKDTIEQIKADVLKELKQELRAETRASEVDTSAEPAWARPLFESISVKVESAARSSSVAKEELLKQVVATEGHGPADDVVEGTPDDSVVTAEQEAASERRALAELQESLGNFGNLETGFAGQLMHMAEEIRVLQAAQGSTSGVREEQAPEAPATDVSLKAVLDEINAKVSRLEGNSVTPSALRETVVEIKRDLLSREDDVHVDESESTLQTSRVGEAVAEAARERDALLALKHSAEEGKRLADDVPVHTEHEWVRGLCDEIGQRLFDMQRVVKDAERRQEKLSEEIEAAMLRQDGTAKSDVVREPLWAANLREDVNRKLNEVDGGVLKVVDDLKADFRRTVGDKDASEIGELRQLIKGLDNRSAVLQLQQISDQLSAPRIAEEDDNVIAAHDETERERESLQLLTDTVDAAVEQEVLDLQSSETEAREAMENLQHMSGSAPSTSTGRGVQKELGTLVADVKAELLGAIKEAAQGNADEHVSALLHVIAQDIQCLKQERESVSSETLHDSLVDHARDEATQAREELQVLSTSLVRPEDEDVPPRELARDQSSKFIEAARSVDVDASARTSAALFQKLDNVASEIKEGLQEHLESGDMKALVNRLQMNEAIVEQLRVLSDDVRDLKQQAGDNAPRSPTLSHEGHLAAQDEVANERKELERLSFAISAVSPMTPEEPAWALQIRESLDTKMQAFTSMVQSLLPHNGAESLAELSSSAGDVLSPESVPACAPHDDDSSHTDSPLRELHSALAEVQHEQQELQSLTQHHDGMTTAEPAWAARLREEVDAKLLQISTTPEEQTDRLTETMKQFAKDLRSDMMQNMHIAPQDASDASVTQQLQSLAAEIREMRQQNASIPQSVSEPPIRQMSTPEAEHSVEQAARAETAPIQEPEWARSLKNDITNRVQALESTLETRVTHTPVETQLLQQIQALTDEVRELKQDRVTSLGSDAGHVGDAVAEADRERGALEELHASLVSQPTPQSANVSSDVLADVLKDIGDKVSRLESASMTPDAMEALVSGMKEDILAQLKAVPSAHSSEQLVSTVEVNSGEAIEATAETAREREALEVLHQSVHERSVNDPESSEPAWAQKLRDDLTEKVSRLEASSVTPDELRKLTDEVRDVVTQQLSSASSPAVVPDNQTQLLAEQVGVLAGEVRDLRDEQTVGLGSDAGHVGDAVAEADRERGALEELHASLTSQPSSVPPESTDVLKDIGDKVTRLESASMTPDAMEALVSGMKEDILAQLKAVPSAQSSDQLVSTVEVNSGEAIEATAETAREREALEVLHQSVHERSVNDPESSEPAWAQKLRDDLTEKVSRLEASSVTPDELRKLTDEVRDVVTQQLSSASSPAVVPDNQTQLLAEQVGVLAGEVRDLRDEQTVGLGSDAGHVGDAVAEADRERGALEELHASLVSQPTPQSANVSSDVMTDVLKDIGDKVSRLESASMTPDAMEALVSGMKEDILAQLKAVPSAQSSDQLVSKVEVNSGEAIEATAETAREREALEVLHQSVSSRKHESNSEHQSSTEEPDWAKRLREQVSALGQDSVGKDTIEQIKADVLKELKQELRAETRASEVDTSAEPAWARPLFESISAKVESAARSSSVAKEELLKQVVATEGHGPADDVVEGTPDDSVVTAEQEAASERRALAELQESLGNFGNLETGFAGQLMHMAEEIRVLQAAQGSTSGVREEQAPEAPATDVSLKAVLDEINAKVSRLEGNSVTPSALRETVAEIKRDLLSREDDVHVDESESTLQTSRVGEAVAEAARVEPMVSRPSDRDTLPSSDLKESLMDAAREALQEELLRNVNTLVSANDAVDAASLRDVCEETAKERLELSMLNARASTHSEGNLADLHTKVDVLLHQTSKECLEQQMDDFVNEVCGSLHTSVQQLNSSAGGDTQQVKTAIATDLRNLAEAMARVERSARDAPYTHDEVLSRLSTLTGDVVEDVMEGVHDVPEFDTLRERNAFDVESVAAALEGTQPARQLELERRLVALVQESMQSGFEEIALKLHSDVDEELRCAQQETEAARRALADMNSVELDTMVSDLKQTTLQKMHNEAVLPAHTSAFSSYNQLCQEPSETDDTKFADAIASLRETIGAQLLAHEPLDAEALKEDLLRHCTALQTDAMKNIKHRIESLENSRLTEQLQSLSGRLAATTAAPAGRADSVSWTPNTDTPSLTPYTEGRPSLRPILSALGSERQREPGWASQLREDMNGLVLKAAENAAVPSPEEKTGRDSVADRELFSAVAEAEAEAARELEELEQLRQLNIPLLPHDHGIAAVVERELNLPRNAQMTPPTAGHLFPRCKTTNPTHARRSRRPQRTVPRPSAVSSSSAL